MWFRTVVDVGFVAKEYFSPLPVPTIAFILTAVRAVFDLDSHRFLCPWLDRMLHRRMERWFTQGDQLGGRAVQDCVPVTPRLA
jgi:hypothetical protein